MENKFLRVNRRSLFPGAAALLALFLLLALRAGPAAAVGSVDFIIAGGFHTCALTPAGAVDCWGDNSYGQAEDQVGPYTQVSANYLHTCALTPAGAVDCWGNNDIGQAEDQTGPYTQVSAGKYHTCALMTTGAVDCWGDNNHNRALDMTGPFTAVGAGGTHTCALTAAGAVNCWGNNVNSQAGNHAGPYTQLSTGENHTCALTTTGVADCWGSTFFGEAADMTGPFTVVSAGAYHTCALTSTGAVDCWGATNQGQSTDQTGPYTQVSAGFDHNCALTSTGDFFCWGRNTNGQLAPPSAAELTVEKVIVGAAPGADWAFTGSPDIGGFELPAGGGTSVFSGLVAGQYTISETDIGGWVPEVFCTPGLASGSNSVTLALADGDAVTCTFTNTLCLAGTYDNGTACVPAAPGFYVPTDGATAQIECATGYYSSSPGATACVAAQPGYEAKTNPADGQTACVPGRYQPYSGWSYCFHADEGYHVPTSAATAQTPCGPGTYQDEESQSSCKLAFPGTYTDSFAAVWPTSCAEGRYQPNAGFSYCISASPGNYVPSSGQTQQFACLPGTVQPNSGQTSCRMAYPGYYAPNSGMADELPCAAGSYQPNHGQIACIAADPGHYVPTTGATAQLECAAGYYSATTGAVACTAAAPGYYVPESGATEQKTCLSGHYSSAPGATDCVRADPGHAARLFPADGQDQCRPGTYQPLSGQYYCLSADKGHYVAGYAEIAQTPCLAGTYQDVEGEAECKPAPAGSYAPNTGMVAATACETGKYQDEAGQTSCKLAPAGSYAPNTGMVAADLCEPGSYQDETGQSACKLAPPGTYAPDSGMTAPLDCAPGYTSAGGATECYLEMGTIIIEKSADPADGTVFAFNDDIEDAGGFFLEHAQTKTFADVPPGQYGVLEYEAVGWTLDDIDCDDTDSTGNTVTGLATINLSDGETVTCTFYNSLDTGTIVIVKEADPADDTLFSFTENILNTGFTLQDPTDNIETFNDVPPGAYTVAENVPAPWLLDNIDCDDDDSIENEASAEATINLEKGETVTCTFYNSNMPPPPPATDLFFSANAAGTTSDGLAYGSEDILKWDGSAWSMWFDGSAAGLTARKAVHDVNAFWIPDSDGDDVALSFTQNRRTVPNITGPVDGTDLVMWNGHAFSLYFDGQDVGLTVLTKEKIDGLHVLDGSVSPIGSGGCVAYLLISTQGPGSVPNHGGGTISFRGDDILGFCATSLGSTTAGLWHMVLDGSAEGMQANSTDSISASDDGQVIYLTTRGSFSAPSASGDHSEVFRFDVATGDFSGPFFDATGNGLPKKVDGLQVNGELP